MGYDIHAVNTDPEEESLKAELVEKINAAVKARESLPKGSKGEWPRTEWRTHLESGGSFYDPPPNATPEYRAAQAEVQRLVKLRDDADGSYFRLNIRGMAKMRDIMVGLDVARMDYTGPDWPEFDKVLPCWLVEYIENTDLSVHDPSLRKGERVLHRRKTRAIDPDEWFGEWRSDPKWRSDDYVDPAPDVVELFEAHEQTLQDTKAWRPDPLDDFRVPLHKLASNDGWLITPEECFYAGNTLRTVRDAEPERYYTVLGAAGFDSVKAHALMNDWIAYLLRVSERGGCKVH